MGLFRTSLIILTLLVIGCDRKHDGKRLLLEWEDADSGVIFRVTEDPGPLVKHNSRLHVEKQGRDRSVSIDDDAIFSTVAFVRHESWLLVVCRGLDEVWAGYDFETGQLYGEYQWNELPFTEWSGQGEVVAERRLNDEGSSPGGFPM